MGTATRQQIAQRRSVAKHDHHSLHSELEH
jgi:hypothetical protein